MLFDITRSINTGMLCYPGDPAVRIEPVASVERDGYAVSRLELSTHTGTHLDPPAHFIEGGLTVDQAPLDLLVGPARVVSVAPTAGAISREMVEDLALPGVQRVLFRTDRGIRRRTVHFQQQANGDLPLAWLTADAARLLADLGARLVGIDTLSIDPLEFPPVSAHQELLSRGVWILERLDLSGVEPGDYELICLPLKIAGGDGAPARALLRSLK